MRLPRSTVVLLSCAVAALGVAACGDDDDDGAATPASTAATTTASDAAPATTSSGLEPSTVDLALKYTGGTAGKADDSLEPVTMGFTINKGGTPSFDEMEAAADAAVKVVNEELGGVDGHPLKLEKCFIKSEEDGQKCAAQFLSADVPLVHLGLAVFGNQSLYKTLNDKIPVLVGQPSTGPDATAKGVYTFSGGSTGIVWSWAKDLEKVAAGGDVALVSVGNPGGKYTMEKILVPMLDKLGVKHGKVVYHSDEATTPEIVSALQAAGASKAKAMQFDPSTPQQCLSLYQAMQQLSITIPVVTSPICNSPAVIDQTGAGPEGWRIWSATQNPRVGDLPDIAAFNNLMEAYGQDKWKYVGFAPETVRDVLTFTKFGNEIGADAITADSMKQAILAFRGPAYASPGPLDCSKPYDKATPAICGVTGIGSAFQDGKWIDLGEIPNESLQ